MGWLLSRLAGVLFLIHNDCVLDDVREVVTLHLRLSVSAVMTSLLL